MADEPQKKSFSWDSFDAAQPAANGKKPFLWSDAQSGPDISSEASMAAHPPTAPKPAPMQAQSPTLARITNIAANQKAPSIPQMEAGNVAAAKFGADTLAGQTLMGPLARTFAEHALPALKAAPIVGRAISAIDEAPGVLGKVARGATVGATTGGVEGWVRGRGLVGSAEEAGKGALIGGGLGLALPAINRLATPEPIEGPGATLPTYEDYALNRGTEISRAMKQQPEAFKIGGPEAQPQLGAPLPSVEDFYANRGKDIMSARRLQPEAFAGPAPEAPPSFPGAHLPDPGEYYANRGTEINRAMRQQPQAFGIGGHEPEPQLGGPLPAAEDFYSNRGTDIMRAMRQQPEAFEAPTAGTAPTVTKPSTNTGVAVLPEPRAPFEGETPNYMASVPRPKLERLALSGKPGAGAQLQQLGQHVVYAPRGSEIESPSMDALRESLGIGSPEPRYAYRAHTIGQPEVDLGAHAHATLSPEEAEAYAQHRNAGANQTVSRIDLNKFVPEHLEETPGPRSANWVKFKRQLSATDYE
jgi:hypothetical protein